MMKKQSDKQVKDAVKGYYSSRVTGCCSDGCCSTSEQLDKIGAVNYQPDELSGLPEQAANMSFGCGNPLAYAGVREGQVVVDIGSGAGLDAMLAARAVGETGRVFGIDMTPEMIEKAEENIRAAKLTNVRFKLGDADNIPLEDNTADWVISNCVINLAPDKERVFGEIYRILKPGGQILISDMVAENIPDEVRSDLTAWAGCIAGAISEEEYRAVVRRCGFTDVCTVDRVEHSLNVDNGVLAEFFPDLPLSTVEKARKQGTQVASIRLAATKVK